MHIEDPSRPWYETAFGELYPMIYAHRDDASAEREVKALLELLDLHGGECALDVCCGGGRHAEAFTDRGLDTWGVDLSMLLLARGTGRPLLAGRLVQGDLRFLPFRPVFDLVFNLFTSFGYFSTEDEDRRALEEMVRVLRPGGRLVLDHMNRAFVERSFVPESSFEKEGVHIREVRRIVENRVEKEILVDDVEGRSFHIKESVRLFTPEEMVRFFQAAGLRDMHVFGDYHGAPLEEGSSRMIVLGTRG